MSPIIRLFLLSAVLLLFTSFPRSYALKKVVTRAQKSDIKYIKCDVCEEIVKQLNRQVQKTREALKGKKKLTELQIIEVAERICDMNRDEGEWIQKLDLVEDGDKLKLVEQPVVGECGVECKTIHATCREVMGDHDTDLAELMFKEEAKRSALSQLLCRTLSKACVTKPPPLPEDRLPGEIFKAKDRSELMMEKYQRSMAEIPGGPGKPKMRMYSREEIEARAGTGKSLDDDEEDDEDGPEMEEVPTYFKRGTTQTVKPKYDPELKQKAKEMAGAPAVTDPTPTLVEKAKATAKQAYSAASQAAAEASETALGMFQHTAKAAQNWMTKLSGKETAPSDDQKAEL